MRDCVVFDMDGLLLDTEKIAQRTFKETCSKFDLTYDEKLYLSCIGSNLQRTAEILNKGIVDFPKEEFMHHWNELYVLNAIENPAPVKDGVFQFLEKLDKEGIPRAVATSSPEKNATKKLKNAKLYDYFHSVTFGDQVTHGKPHPEIYLTAARKLNMDPKNCLALEDSDNGVKAAHGADMLVIQIPDMISPSQQVLDLGHHIAENMDEVHALFFSGPARKDP